MDRETLLREVSEAAGPGAAAIVAERIRQREVEGWTPEHDDAHGDGVLAVTAATLAVDGTDARVVDPDGYGTAETRAAGPPSPALCSRPSSTGWTAPARRRGGWAMGASDVLRSFAESRSGDAEVIRDGITYGQAREATAALSAAETARAAAEARATQAEGERDEARAAMRLSPSQVCERYHLQACHVCERAECGDNTSPAVLALREARAERDRLRDAGEAAVAVADGTAADAPAACPEWGRYDRYVYGWRNGRAALAEKVRAALASAPARPMPPADALALAPERTVAEIRRDHPGVVEAVEVGAFADDRPTEAPAPVPGGER